MIDDVLDYDYLLERAKENLPEMADDHERFQMPKVDLQYEGRKTIIRNMSEICRVIRRDPEEVMAYLLKELGTAGQIEGQRAVFNGIIDENLINTRMNSYVETYVLCSECHRPDTHIVKEGRTLVLVCEACGARRPLKVKKSSSDNKEVIREGMVYEFTVDNIGKKGDGVIHYGKYTIYVPDVTKGQKVKVKIQRLQGTLAFGVKAE